jgi:hypothetical protein
MDLLSELAGRACMAERGVAVTRGGVGEREVDE